MAIGFYYSVVAGWCIKYFLMSVSGELLERPALEVWEGLASGRGQQVLFHFVALSLATLVIVKYLIILPEEAYLEFRFGNEYRRYKESVRRWF